VISAAGVRIRRPRMRGFPLSARLAAVVAALLLLVALLGPLVAPHDPSASIGAPYSGPSGDAPLGTDELGRDVLSRVLHGGLTVIAFAGLATALAYLVATPIGLIAGYTRSRLDAVLMRAMDVLLAIPPVLLLLVLATGTGASTVVLVLGIALVHIPQISRIVRAATLETSVRGYVEAAEARGDPTPRILAREILPNIAGPVLADLGVRLTGSILLAATVNFLGLGLQPPAADWALMISENRDGISIQPRAVAAPAVLLALLAVSVNLVADAFARRLGVSIPERAG
jgi:peptide/nickel transport system permease protein